MAHRGAGSAVSAIARDGAAAPPRDALAAIFPFPGRASSHFLPAAGEGCPELDCLRGRLSPKTLTAAERRAAEIGVGADRVLVAAGVITDEAYLTALANWHGIHFDPLEPQAFRDCPVTGDRLIEAASAGILPLHDHGALIWVIAPRGLAARRLCALLEQYPDLTRRVRVTSSAHLNHFIARHAADALRRRASGGLQRQYPEFSAAARSGANRTPVAMALAAALALPAGLTLAPAATLLTVNVVLAAVFASWIGLRLFGSMIREPRMRPANRTADNELPVYSVIAALYREATSIEPLLRALRALDYPPEKLDLKIVLEADDHDTRRVAAFLQSRYRFEIIIAPAGEPRTKPKALNAALAFARGTFTVIYDAEDRPEPHQLRRALEMFRRGGPGLACVQARLTIDNTADGILPRLFTAEYAGQFDVFLPGVATLNLPFPLGGSSNHFRTSTLLAVGAWDPWNVTEDADLGLRLARFGYRSAVAASTTYEEAPARLRPWLRQRTRWFKGWMQTWCVSMRRPGRLVRDLGPAGFVAVQLMIGGTVLSALVHPIFILSLAYWLVAGVGDPGNVPAAALVAINAGVCAAGYLSSAAIGWDGLNCRGLRASAWVLLLMPVHWLLLSFAAWRALVQLLSDPYRWEKTEHGLARTSRRAKRLRAGLRPPAGAQQASPASARQRAELH